MNEDADLAAILQTTVGKVRFAEGKTSLPVVFSSGAADVFSYPDLQANVYFENGYGLAIKTIINPPLAPNGAQVMAAADEDDFQFSTFTIIPFMCGKDGKKQPLAPSLYTDALVASYGLFSDTFVRQEWEMAGLAHVNFILHFLATQVKRPANWAPQQLTMADATYLSSDDVMRAFGCAVDDYCEKMLRTRYGVVAFHPVIMPVPAASRGKQGDPMRCQGWRGGLLFSNGYAVELSLLDPSFTGLAPAYPACDINGFHNSKFRLRLLAKAEDGSLSLLSRDEVAVFKGLWHRATMLDLYRDDPDQHYAVGVFTLKQVEALATAIMMQPRQEHADRPLRQNYEMCHINHNVIDGQSPRPC